jgi:hypothetical protein
MDERSDSIRNDDVLDTIHNDVFDRPENSTKWKSRIASPCRKIAGRRYRIRPRNKKFTPILFGEKLTQQYVIDQFIRQESERIQWIKVSNYLN